MQTYKHYTVKMPSYALSYLVNRDDSGLEPQDKAAIDGHMEKYYKEADSVSGSLVQMKGQTTCKTLPRKPHTLTI